MLLASCDAVPLASRYRWRIKVVGVDADYRLAASTKSPLAQLGKVLPGQTVELIVQAANQTSQSLPSESVFVTLPALAAVAPLAKAAPDERAAGYTNLAATASGPEAEGNGSVRSSRRLESARSGH